MRPELQNPADADAIVFGPEYGYNPATGGWSLVVDVPNDMAPTPARGAVAVCTSIDVEKGVITFSSPPAELVCEHPGYLLSVRLP